MFILINDRILKVFDFNIIYVCSFYTKQKFIVAIIIEPSQSKNQLEKIPTRVGIPRYRDE